ncbi:hypothetical protein CHLRE_12g515650v5 [Chlamydomonas reinhardtii]|uniref:Eukaryotic translation initiation factor 3 subunit K n=1 Tax=Chlamydomonas reinhardtii TaxID=3055 RepID=A8JHW7_CHLRE|nr:uncharacterized protein CHLRE_12g515650v5 [Chlamydomonas reinhardtii]PNW75170.1 hypothetical protein CHLRE_12g515650v5 [Chlamydomonas reinhardtii]|eukprot:XP_001703228.1 eukaryotic initiation factor [Chlamydomonas reinhardtii]
MSLIVTGADRYSPDKLPQLEAYVDEQVANRSWSLDANVTLLRFYQFSPASVKPAIVAKVLIKAIMQAPAQDYKCCITLLPERLLQSDESVYKVVQLANALETSRFGDFWNAANTCRDLLGGIPGFYESVRGFIAHTLVHTYGRVTKRTLADCLKLEGATLEQYLSEKCKSAGWSIVNTPAGEVVGLPKNDDNQSVVKRTQELIRFDQVAPMLKAVTVGF